MKVRTSLVRTTVVAIALVSTSAFGHGGHGPGTQGMQGGMGMMPGQGMQGGMGMMPGQGMQGGMGMMPGQGMQGGMGMMPGQGMMSGQGMQGGMGMMGMSVDDLTPEQLDRIGDHMQSMHESMSNIAEESDPQARRVLVKEHLASMQAFMQERMKMMRENMMAKSGQSQDWRNHMEQRMHRMEEMMKQRSQE